MKFDDALEINTALAIYAHPDDNEWNSGGTIASWVKQGVEVNLVLVTNGASGSSNPEMTREKLKEIRMVEQRQAADVLGVKEVVMLGFEDGYLYPDLELRKAIAREIRRFRPDVVLTHNTERLMADYYANHPDHIATGEVVLRSINPDASSGLMFPELWKEEGFAPFLPKAVFIGTFGFGPVFTDISDTVEQKIEALKQHRSQMENPDDIEMFVRERFKQMAQEQPYEFAESYRLLRTNLE
ncbi:MAG TPA: PIG-L deacetylase family protein [Actinomycetota bacterium]|nr:PIG-L deacetylase family protein [Actinomycetota bacterium]